MGATWFMLVVQLFCSNHSYSSKRPHNAIPMRISVCLLLPELCAVISE